MGWIYSDVDWTRKVLFSALSISVAVAIPKVAEVLGKSWASIGSLVAAIIFGLVTAYSTHNAYVVMMDEPRREAYLASDEVKRFESKLASATEAVKDAQTALKEPAELTPLPTCVCPQTIGRIAKVREAEQVAHERNRVFLAASLEAAKAEESAALTALEAKVRAYKPMAPDWIVWLAGSLIDLGILMGVLSVEMTQSVIARRIAKAKAEAEEKSLETERRALVQTSQHIEDEFRAEMEAYRIGEGELSDLEAEIEAELRAQAA